MNNIKKQSKIDNYSYKLKRLKIVETVLMVMLFAMLIAIILLLNIN